MAYLRSLKFECDSYGCSKSAVVELVNWRNAPCGKFCRKHGEQQKKRQEEMEQGMGVVR